MTGSSKLDTYSRGLGAHVRRLRKSVSLTQEELAKRTGLSADTIRRLEASSFSPTLATLFRIAAAFGQTPAQLLAEMEDQSATSGEFMMVTAYRSSDPQTRRAMRASVAGIALTSGPITGSPPA